ncbi:MAG: hypothetical protein AVDCRST_MAG76-702, partial [uncultured Acidimicrobiales bacterium]
GSVGGHQGERGVAVAGTAGPAPASRGSRRHGSGRAGSGPPSRATGV